MLNDEQKGISDSSSFSVHTSSFPPAAYCLLIMKQLPEPSFDVESSNDDSMDDLFESIGFEIFQADDYYTLLENTDRVGAQSSIHRGKATLQGYCWKVGEGLEVWSWLCSDEGKIFYEDCRPAFRSRYAH